MVKKEDTGIYLSQIRTNVSFSSFLTAVVVFFVGILISKFNEYDISVKVPISFLIIATFGFLYSAVIYTNASEEVIKGNFKKFKSNILLGDILSEYFGLYLLILSIPLAVNVITTDVFLRAITAISSFSGLALYHFFHFSISERHFPKKYVLISSIILILGIVLFFSQLYNFLFEYLAILLIIVIFCIAILAIKLSKN